jgi:ABC-2 type transport system permease protein
LRRNLAAARLAVLSQLEYRLNFLIDAVIQPCLTSVIEVTLWLSILSGMGKTSLGGFGREYYLAYSLFATFVGRVTANWMYEFTMLDDIDSGRINSILVRPISFYEFYLSQFVGYKMMTLLIPLILPIGICLWFQAPLHLERIPLMILFIAYYLIFVHTLSFCIACLAFFLNRAHSITGLKNLAIWVLAGEMIPLDLYPEPLKSLLIHSPFAAGVYIPVGYITGRFDLTLLTQSFVSVTLGTVVVGVFAATLWMRGLRAYTGTGA